MFFKNVFLKIEFSVATTTFFRVTWLCSDLYMHDSSVKRGYHISKYNNINFYVTGAARDNKKNIM